ncbi:MAG: hypothetical protein A2W99_15265 [Bacteroidetes bacterium GWF2_33_16]|nr:MAG: hypothetical protein A2X00_09475 [Bacteroidetes bacterium GWE2_32_14]OFY07682.1 MAG: hypothetical protein A2W99_15265 [Bacteroidetes bacterium GWF2_33_16]
MRTFLKIELLLSFLFSSLFLYSGNGKPLIINYTKEIYGADNQNWSLSSDINGIMYIANNKGLLEFDGSNWLLNKMPEGEGIRSVLVENPTRVYIGAYEEFGYWEKNEKGEKRYVSLSKSIPKVNIHNDEIWRIDSLNGNIYFQSFSTIFKYDGHEISIINPESSIVLLLKARARLFIHLIGKGLHELINDKLVLLTGSEFLANDEVKFVLPYKGNEFLIGTSENGILIYNNQGFSKWDVPIANLIIDSKINNGIFLNKNYVIGTITNGIFIIDENGELKHHFNTSNFLQNNTVLALYANKYGNLWVALDRGIDYIDFNGQLDFYVDPFYTIGSVYTGVLDEKNLWIGTNKGLYKYSINKTDNTFADPELIDGTQGQVWSLDIIDNQLICGHTSGTFSIKEGSVLRISSINGGYDIKRMTLNNENILVQSTYSSLVIYKKNGKNNEWEFSNIVGGFIEPIPNIEIDHLGNIWASHLKRGIFKIQLNNTLDSIKSIKYFSKNEGFSNEKEVLVGKIVNRIVFVNGGSIYTYDDLNDTILLYDLVNSQLREKNEIKKLIEAKENQFWIIEDQCLSLHKKENETIDQIFSYDLSRQGLYFPSDYQQIVPLENRTHLICLDNGFAIYNQSKDIDSVSFPKLTMRNVTISKSNGDSKQLYLSATDEKNAFPFYYRNIQFTFSSSELTVKPVYRFILKGLYNDYSSWANESVVDYKRLPYGKYEFIVQSKTIEGQLLQPLVYSFEILPPFYATKLAFVFYGLSFAGLIVLSFIIFKKRLEKIRKREREKRETAILKGKQEFMDLKNRSLQTELYYKNVQLANHALAIGTKNDLLIKLKNNIKSQLIQSNNNVPAAFLIKQISLLDRYISDENEWKTFENYFDQIHQGFFKRLIEQYPDLTQGDLKLCAYLRLNLSSKEISPLLNISFRGVEARRYRLRKRLNFEHDKNLVEFLIKF